MKTKNQLTIMLCMLGSVLFAQTDPFAGRPTSAGSDVASNKENVPAKKETFTAKIDRYKAEGFKVAVVLFSGDIKTKAPIPTATTSVSTQITLEGSLPSVKEDLAPLLESFTATMNESFNTDIFEIVDMNAIPYKETKFGKVDDWGATKYKMVVMYYAEPIYDYMLSGSKYSAALNVNLNATATEFVNEKGDVKMKYPIRAGNLGFFKSGVYETETDPGLKTIDELHALVNPPMGADLLAELQKEQDANMDKFIEKRK